MKVFYFFVLVLIYSTVLSQNVGINQNSPTNSLHISPFNTGDNPIRIDGIQPYTIGDTALLIINQSTGIVKYINTSDFLSIISNGAGFGTDSQNIDSLILSGYNLETFITNGDSASVNLNPLVDSISNSIINNTDFENQIVSILYDNADTLLYNSDFINNLRDSIDTDIDSLVLNGTLLTIYENGTSASADISSLIELPNSAITNQVLTWNGTEWIAQNASSGADNWGTQTVVTGSGISGNGTVSNPLINTFIEIDGSVTNEIQTISKTGSTVTLSNSGGSFTDDNTQLTEAQVDAFTNNNGYLTSFTEVDGSVTNEIQNISGSSFNSSTGNLVIGIQNGTNQTVNLNGLKDHDWYEVGGTAAPDNINDNIFTQGNVGIGVTNPTTKLEVAGIVSISKGSLISPAYTFINDLQTGIFQPTVGELGIVTNNRNYRAHFSPLEIRVGNNLNTLDLGIESKFIIEGSENGPGNGTDFASLGFSNHSNQSGQSIAEIAKILCSSQDASANQGRLEFQTKNGTILKTNMIIDKNGQVGIGTENPLAKFHVFNGDAYFTDQPINNFSTSRSGEAVVLDNLKAASDNGIRLYDGNSNSHLHMGSITHSYLQAYNTASIGPGTLGTGALDFDDNANFANLSINPLGGNVGIGTTSPSEKVQINGSIKIVDGTQGLRKVLTSDATGKGSWKELSKTTTFNGYKGPTTWSNINPALNPFPYTYKIANRSNAITITQKGQYEIHGNVQFSTSSGFYYIGLCKSDGTTISFYDLDVQSNKNIAFPRSTMLLDPGTYHICIFCVGANNCSGSFSSFNFRMDQIGY